jgi:hypothetical protein
MSIVCARGLSQNPVRHFLLDISRTYVLLYRLRKSRGSENMRLLRLAIETQKWELAAHVLILGAIKARQSENDKPGGKDKKKHPQGQGKQV